MPTNLLKIVARTSTLKTAWKKIKHRPDSRGFDEITISAFDDNLDREIRRLRTDLLSGNFRFTPLLGVAIPKEGKTKEGKPKIRPLKIPAVRDRVVQKAIELTIVSHIKKVFPIENPASYAYIKNRSVENAILKIKVLREKGFVWAYIADIERFFDSVDIEILLQKFIFRCLPDSSLNETIRKALSVELGNGRVLEEMGVYSEFPAAGSGIPQGGTLSPLSLTLTRFDPPVLT